MSKGYAGCGDSKGQVTFDFDAIKGRAANADLMDLQYFENTGGGAQPEIGTAL